MLTPEDKKLWEEVMAGVTRIIPRSARHETKKMSIRVRDVSVPHELDLHGLTVQEAYAETLKFLRAAHHARYKHVTIVTGLSGQIKSEFETWVSPLPYVREVTQLNGGGAYKVKFFKPKR